jgi:hypothetical protein
MKGEIIIKRRILKNAINRFICIRGYEEVVLRVSFHNSEYFLHEVERLNREHDIDGKVIVMTVVIDKSEKPDIEFEIPLEEISDPAKRHIDLSEHEKLIEKIISS